MSEPSQALKDDIAFLRELTQDTGAGFQRDGAIMALVGLIFGLLDLAYWAIFRGWLHPPGWVSAWMWAAALLAFFVVGHLATRRLPRPSGAAARAMVSAWSSVGVCLLAAGVGLLLGGVRLNQPQLVLQVFPVVLFALYGGAWSVAYAVKRATWFAWIALGCFLAAIACGALMGSPDEWLVLALGLFGLVAGPGVAIVRQSRAL